MSGEKTVRAGHMYGISALSAVLLVILDQYTKFLAVRHLKGRNPFVLIPGVLELNYLENTGMAWGMFAGRRWLFLILSAVFFLIVLYVLARIPKRSNYIPLIAALVMLVSGGAGNFIDRARTGAVTDFIYVSLINFPTFNIADILVVCGGILLFLLCCVKYRNDDFSFLNLKRNR